MNAKNNNRTANSKPYRESSIGTTREFSFSQIESYPNLSHIISAAASFTDSTSGTTVKCLLM